MRSIRWLSICLLLCGLAWGCEDPGPGTEKPPEVRGSECSNARDCLKKRCPQPGVNEYNSCVKKLLASQDSSPEYVSCNAGKCEDAVASEMGDGLVEVTFPDATKEKVAKDSVEWLRLYIFPPKDLDGKDITCARLKAMADATPASMMSSELGRYFPPPDFDQPITADVLRTGDSLDLPYVNTHATVPAGANRVFVVQGFCNPKEGRPTNDTAAMWWGCKEGIETKVGKKSTTVSVELPVQNGDRCPK